MLKFSSVNWQKIIDQLYHQIASFVVESKNPQKGNLSNVDLEGRSFPFHICSQKIIKQLYHQIASFVVESENARRNWSVQCSIMLIWIGVFRVVKSTEDYKTITCILPNCRLGSRKRKRQKEICPYSVHPVGVSRFIFVAEDYKSIISPTCRIRSRKRKLV